MVRTWPWGSEVADDLLNRRLVHAEQRGQMLPGDALVAAFFYVILRLLPGRPLLQQIVDAAEPVGKPLVLSRGDVEHAASAQGLYGVGSPEDETVAGEHDDGLGEDKLDEGLFAGLYGLPVEENQARLDLGRGDMKTEYAVVLDGLERQLQISQGGVDAGSEQGGCRACR